MHGDYSEVHDIQVIIYFTDHHIHIHIDKEQTNIPIVYNSLVSDNDN